MSPKVSYTIPIKQKPPKESEVLSIVTYGGDDYTSSVTFWPMRNPLIL